MQRLVYPHIFKLLALSLLGIFPSWVQAQTPPAYYATNGGASFSRSCLLGISCGNITNAANAVDGDFSSYATIRPSILSLGFSPVALRMPMDTEVPKNYRAGVVIGAATGLSAIGTITLRTYLKGQAAPQQTLDVTSVATVALGSTTPGRVEFLATERFDQIEIEINSLLGVSYDVRVYYAYGVNANLVETARGVVSRFAPAAGTTYSTAGVDDNDVQVCVNSNVLNPERAVDQDLTNYATFGAFVGVSCPNTLKVKLEAPVPAGYQAGFVVGQQGLLDVNALTGLRLTTYRNGVRQESATGAQLLAVNVLPGGKQQISFPSTLPFDEVRLTRTSTVGALDNLAVYYGFGLEPSVFRDQTPVLSNFSSGANQFDVSSDGVLCALCANVNVLNPERAADNNLNANDYAVIRTGLLGALTSSALRLNLNGTGVAGNAAGVVLNQGAGLLNTQLLSGITLRTYGGPTGTQLLETASGTSLLQQSLLTDGRVEVFFRTTQNFQRVEVEVNNAVTALDQTRIYYAFAQDRPQGFPTTITPPALPLPVELRAFRAQAAGTAVAVSWQTASEQSNSYFVVERAQQPTEGFVALGKVAGAGTSANGHAYAFRDETALTLGATLLYYRLRQVDTDGKETLSPVAIVTLGKQAAVPFEVYPNPASTAAEVQVRLSGSENSPATTLAIYNVRGNLVRQMLVNERIVKLADVQLPAGIYNLVLLGPQNQRLQAQRLVVTGR